MAREIFAKGIRKKYKMKPNQGAVRKARRSL